MWIICLRYKDFSDYLLSYGGDGVQTFADLTSAHRQVEKIKSCGAYQRGDITEVLLCRMPQERDRL